MKVDMSPEGISERFAMLSRLYVPMTLEEASGEPPVVEPVDMSPEAISARFRELAALWRLTCWLQARVDPEQER